MKTSSLDQLTPEERAKVKAAILESHSSAGRAKPEAEWLIMRASRVLDDPERFKLVLESWSERFAVLTLPMAAGLLSLAFMFQRRFFVFDHTIFSLHSLSAVGLLFTGTELLAPLVGGGSNLLLLGAPVHLFVHMRGVYGTGIPGTLLRMGVLFVASCVVFALLVLGLVLAGLQGLRA